MKRGHPKQMSESFLTAAFLSLSGGLQDAYTYIYRGHVFANAQTGNIVLLSQSIAERNWTQKELAKRAGISQNAYSGIERGTQFPKYTSLVGIANAFGCSVKDLILEE